MYDCKSNTKGLHNAKRARKFYSKPLMNAIVSSSIPSHSCLPDQYVLKINKIWVVHLLHDRRHAAEKFNCLISFVDCQAFFMAGSK